MATANDNHSSGLRYWRQWAEQEVERLIELMDRMDGDPDFEPYLTGATSDLEDDTDDNEPSLGWSITGGTGRHDLSRLLCDLEEDDPRCAS
jgi:hypothetical protein